MMAKRKMEKILNETLAENSKKLYTKRWADFLEFMGKPMRRPSEEDFLQYFDFLKNTKGQAASSLWSIYSSLNSVHQQEYSEKLQSFHKLTQLLQSYNSTYERKVAAVFESVEIDEFLQMELLANFWIVRKAAVVVALCGDLRTVEIRGIKLNDVLKTEDDGYEISVAQRKPSGGERKKFVVPEPYSRYLSNYLVAIRASLGENVDGPLIKGVPNESFINKPMGKTYLSNIGKDVAGILQLENPERYTGYCFRRTDETMTITATNCMSNTVKKETDAAGSSDNPFEKVHHVKVYSGDNNVFHFS